MKIPKYIDKLLDRRARLAEDLNSVDYEITKWIDKNGIEIEEYDYATGVEMYANPYASANRIREAIKNKENCARLQTLLCRRELTDKDFKSPTKRYQDCLSCANSVSDGSSNGDVLRCMLHSGKIVREDECCDEWN